MCTVTFIPRRKGFLVASNRDEHVLRPYALTPAVYPFTGGRIAFPKDGKAGGTWIGAHERGDVMVLLNGAFERHIPQPAYRKSRGLIFLDILQQPDPAQGFDETDLTDIEPFTLVLYTGGRLWDLRWDGVQKYKAQVDERQPHIWSSAMLYEEAVRRHRETWFREWLTGRDPETITLEDVRDFHTFGGQGASPEEALVMSRDQILKTVSITIMEQQPDASVHLYYHDLVQETETAIDLGKEG